MRATVHVANTGVSVLGACMVHNCLMDLVAASPPFNISRKSPHIEDALDGLYQSELVNTNDKRDPGRRKSIIPQALTCTWHRNWYNRVSIYPFQEEALIAQGASRSDLPSSTG
jgi:hypothetical protein